MKVRQYLGFESDNRISIDIYADSIAQGLQGRSINLELFQAQSSLERYANSIFLMRYLRYLNYSRQIPMGAVDVHHVLDHGYAHLHPKLKGGKTCITVHDLIPMLNWKGAIAPVMSPTSIGPSIKPKVAKPMLNLYSLGFLDKYDQIIAVSNSTAQDMVEHLSISLDKISIIPPVISSRFQPNDSESIAEFSRQYELDRSCKWVMVSGQEFYKNHLGSLLVLEQLKKHTGMDIKIIKTGKPSAEFDQLVSSLGLEDSVRQVFFEDPDDLPKLYSFVDCLLFSSLYEGFGMPVIEAFACGTPVVTSNRGSLPEVVGSLAPTFDPSDIDGMAAAIKNILEVDAPESGRLTHDGPLWVKQFRADAVCQRMEQLYIEMSDLV
ncbi:MAG: glycosyltransferase involved in cell wall biosynthesis [Pseudoalteromonas tetraodonis]|jgi:glycosyltransferase involved in cell wall biosynthesis